MTPIDKTAPSQTESIAFEFDLHHAPEKVWRALTDPVLLTEWLLPVALATIRPFPLSRRERGSGGEDASRRERGIGGEDASRRERGSGGEDYAAGATTPGVSPVSASGSAFDRNGPSTLRALAHAPIARAHMLAPPRPRRRQRLLELHGARR